MYAAPIVLSGRPTFAGYITLDDTSTWLALTDRVMDHGRTLSGLAPSTYQQVLADYFGMGYPLGAFLPLGLGEKLTGQDVAWLFQPTMAFYGAMLSLAIYAAAARLVSSRALRALVGFLGAQAALLFSYALWSGIKEVAAASMIALVCASVAATIDRWQSLRSTLPGALAAAALLAVLSPAGGIWLVTPAVVVLAVLVPTGLRLSARIAGVLLAAIALLSIPSIAIARSFISSARGGGFTSSGDVVNLGHPLDALQVFGIWPATDFRGRPHNSWATYVLIGVLLAGIVVGLVLARRRRAWGMPLYLATGAGGLLLVAALDQAGLGSPWLNGKAMAEASPALVGAGAAGAAALFEARHRVAASAIGAAIAFGLLWSNGLAYSNAWLAPAGRMAELQSIGARFAGQGPALMTDVEPYGVRHFLRNLDPEGASDRRRRLIPLLSGQGLAKDTYADLDGFRLHGILVYRTLVLARSPSESRPPSAYRLVLGGRYYDVWQRSEAARAILSRLPLGDDVQPASVPRCSDAMRLAAVAGPSGRLAAAPRVPAVVVDFAGVPLPNGWQSDAGGHVIPSGGGAIARDLTVPDAGRYGRLAGRIVQGPLAAVHRWAARRRRARPAECERVRATRAGRPRARRPPARAPLRRRRSPSRERRPPVRARPARPDARPRGRARSSTSRRPGHGRSAAGTSTGSKRSEPSGASPTSRCPRGRTRRASTCASGSEPQARGAGRRRQGRTHPSVDDQLVALELRVARSRPMQTETAAPFADRQRPRTPTARTRSGSASRPARPARSAGIRIRPCPRAEAAYARRRARRGVPEPRLRSDTG